MTRTATVVLAAGAGRRLGGRGKALIEVGGCTLAHRAVRAAVEAGTTPVLVLGHAAETTEEALRAQAPDLLAGTSIVRAREWETGMAASFRAGVDRAAELGAARAAVLLADQPGIGAEALEAVLAAQVPGNIARGAVEGRAGHPVVLGIADALAAARLASGDHGARAYLARHRERTVEVDITALASDADVDTPEDLELARRTHDA